jgi:hypothetical protein
MNLEQSRAIAVSVFKFAPARVIVPANTWIMPGWNYESGALNTMAEDAPLFRRSQIVFERNVLEKYFGVLPLECILSPHTQAVLEDKEEYAGCHFFMPERAFGRLLHSYRHLADTDWLLVHNGTRENFGLVYKLNLNIRILISLLPKHIKPSDIKSSLYNVGVISLRETSGCLMDFWQEQSVDVVTTTIAFSTCEALADWDGVYA